MLEKEIELEKLFSCYTERLYRVEQNLRRVQSQKWCELPQETQERNRIDQFYIDSKKREQGVVLSFDTSYLGKVHPDLQKYVTCLVLAPIEDQRSFLLFYESSGMKKPVKERVVGRR